MIFVLLGYAQDHLEAIGNCHKCKCGKITLYFGDCSDCVFKKHNRTFSEVKEKD